MAEPAKWRRFTCRLPEELVQQVVAAGAAEGIVREVAVSKDAEEGNLVGSIRFLLTQHLKLRAAAAEKGIDLSLLAMGGEVASVEPPAGRKRKKP